MPAHSSRWGTFRRTGVTVKGTSISLTAFGYLKDQTEMLDWFKDAGSRIERIPTSGQSSPATLRTFAAAISAKVVIPVHGGNCDTEQDGFGGIVRPHDAEVLAI